MKTQKKILVHFIFLIGAMCLLSCKSARFTFLGVIHYETQCTQKPDILNNNQNPAQATPDGIYKGSGGSGSIYGTIVSSDSMLVKKAMISFRPHTENDTILNWNYLNSTDKGEFRIDNLPDGAYDLLAVNINSKLFVARNLVLSGSSRELKLDVVLLNINQ